jgi:lysophospholipase L1-like esterase
VTVKPVDEKCLVLGDSIVRNFEAGKLIMRVQCFPGIGSDQLRRVMEKEDLEHSDYLVIHVGTNDVRRPRNLDYIMGEVYDFVNATKAKFPGSTLVLSVLRNKGMKWRRVGSANDRLEWVARTLGATFVDPNSWIQDQDFGRDGFHLNRYGAKQLGDLCSRVCGINN